MTLVTHRVDVPVTIDESLCIDGCTLCVEVLQATGFAAVERGLRGYARRALAAVP